jgi:hypothetical protein
MPTSNTEHALLPRLSLGPGVNRENPSTDASPKTRGYRQKMRRETLGRRFHIQIGILAFRYKAANVVQSQLLDTISEFLSFYRPGWARESWSILPRWKVYDMDFQALRRCYRATEPRGINARSRLSRLSSFDRPVLSTGALGSYMIRDVQSYSESDKKSSPTKTLWQLTDSHLKIWSYYIKKTFLDPFLVFPQFSTQFSTQFYPIWCCNSIVFFHCHWFLVKFHSYLQSDIIYSPTLWTSRTSLVQRPWLSS